MNTVDVKVIRLPHGADLPLPDYHSAQAAGLDLLAAVTADLTIQPGQRALVPAGSSGSRCSRSQSGQAMVSTRRQYIIYHHHPASLPRPSGA